MYISSRNHTNYTINSQNASNMCKMPPMGQMGGMGQPPQMGNSNGSSDIKTFLDKVKNGTATESDISEMKDKLTELKQKYGATTPSIGGNESDEITSFLDKVQSGTATTDDLTAMKDTLAEKEQEMKQRMSSMGGMMGGMGGMPPMPPPGDMPPSDDSTASAIGEVLSKVQNGTVTDEDLQNLQTLLTSLDKSESTSDSSSSSSSTTSRSQDPELYSIKEFLDKVKSGTVTDSDLSTMKTQLSKMQGESGLEQMPPMMGGMNTLMMGSNNYASNSNSDNQYSQQFINAVMQAYSQNNGSTYSFWTSAQNYSA